MMNCRVIVSSCLVLWMMALMVNAQQNAEEEKRRLAELVGGLNYQRGRGLIGDIGAQHDFYKGKHDAITGTGSVSKVLIGPGHREQPIGSASLGYSHQDGRGSYGAGVEHIQGLGTMASGGANYDLYQGKNSRLNLEAKASQGLSGMAREMKPNFEGFINYEKRFKRDMNSKF